MIEVIGSDAKCLVQCLAHDNCLINDSSYYSSYFKNKKQSIRKLLSIILLREDSDLYYGDGIVEGHKWIH